MCWRIFAAGICSFRWRASTARSSYSRMTMSAAARIVQDGGTIILAAKLNEGLGSSEFQRVMAENPDLKAFKQRILGKDYFVMDQWQLEELAQVVERCKVRVVSDGIAAETLRKCYVEPAATVEQAVAECLAEYGPKAQVAVIPKGPYVLPYVA